MTWRKAQITSSIRFTLERWYSLLVPVCRGLLHEMGPNRSVARCCTEPGLVLSHASCEPDPRVHGAAWGTYDFTAFARPFVHCAVEMSRKPLRTEGCLGGRIRSLVPVAGPHRSTRHSFADRLIAVVTVPKSECDRVYRRRLVMILGPGGKMRRGLIEVVRRDEALIRYV